MMFLRNFSPFDANTGKLSAWRLWLWQDVAILLIFGSAMLFSQAFIFNFIAKWAGWLTMVPGVSSLAAKLLPSTVAANLLPLFATALGGLAIGFAALILRVLARNDAGAAGDIGIYHLALVAVWFLTMGQLSPAAKAILMPFLVHDAVAGAGLIWCAPPFKARRFVERLFGGATV